MTDNWCPICGVIIPDEDEYCVECQKQFDSLADYSAAEMRQKEDEE